MEERKKKRSVSMDRAREREGTERKGKTPQSPTTFTPFTTFSQRIHHGRRAPRCHRDSAELMSSIISIGSLVAQYSVLVSVSVSVLADTNISIGIAYRNPYPYLYPLSVLALVLVLAITISTAA